MVAGTEPPGFRSSPWAQHTRVLRAAYDEAALARLGVSQDQWQRMLREYRWSYVWRHLRKSETSTLAARGVQRLIMVKKTLKHHVLHGVYHLLVLFRAMRARLRGPRRPDKPREKAKQA